jgi:hypothetical protein
VGSMTIPVIVTLINAVLGMILWLRLIYWNKRAPISSRDLIIIILIVGIACRIVFVVFSPIFYAPDEQSHYNYIKYLYENQRFPIQVSRTYSPANDYEYYQPPLYYLASLPIYGVSRAIFNAGDDLTVRAIRLFSIALWIVNVLFLTKVINRLRINSIFVRIFTVSMVGLLPTYTFLSSSINNDNLLITIGGIILYLMTKENQAKMSLLIGFLLGLALLTKLTAVVYIALVIFLFLNRLVSKSLPLSSVAVHMILIGMPAFFVSLPWYIRNLYIYGDITAEKVANIPMLWDSIYTALIRTLVVMQQSFWAAAGIYNNVVFLPTIGICLTYLAIAGICYGVISKTESFWNILDVRNNYFIAAISMAIVVNLILVARFGILYNQGQGRFLFPLLIPISLFMAVGITFFGIEKRTSNAALHAVGFFATYILAFTGFSLAVPFDGTLHVVGFLASPLLAF